MRKMAVIDFLIMRQLEIRDPWGGGGAIHQLFMSMEGQLMVNYRSDTYVKE